MASLNLFALTAFFFLHPPSPASSALTANDQVACQLLTQAQIDEAIGAKVDEGSANGPTLCSWAAPGKIVTLSIKQTLAGKSPIQQFDAGKTSKMIGVTIEPVTGVGNDAYYVYSAGQDHAGCGLVVKKGTTIFEVLVYGFDLAQAKPVAKTLALAAGSKI